jgi:hypothetical protein
MGWTWIPDGVSCRDSTFGTSLRPVQHQNSSTFEHRNFRSWQCPMWSRPINERSDCRPCDCRHGRCWNVLGVRSLPKQDVLRSTDQMKGIKLHLRLYKQQRSIRIQRSYWPSLGPWSDTGSGHRRCIFRRECNLAMGKQFSSPY